MTILAIHFANAVLCNFSPTGCVDGDGRRKFHCGRCNYLSVFIPDKGQFITRICDKQNGALPGNELKMLIRNVGGKEGVGCGCEDMVRQMNAWGPDGCRENRDEIIATLQESASKLGWWETITIGNSLRKEPWFRITDPAGSMVDEAIRRAEVNLVS